MAKGIAVLADTFPCAAGSGIVGNRVVVMDPANPGNVKLPAITTPEKTAVGVAKEKASGANNVAVNIIGVLTVESDGTAVINPGDNVICGALGDGRIKAKALAAGSANVYQILGMCVAPAQVPAVLGALCEVLWSPDIVVAA